LEHEWILTFHSVGNFIIPTDELIYIYNISQDCNLNMTPGLIISVMLLVGGLEHEFYFLFHILYGIILPIDELIFFNMVETTN
jgi:hypothetical protein